MHTFLLLLTWPHVPVEYATEGVWLKVEADKSINGTIIWPFDALPFAADIILEAPLVGELYRVEYFKKHNAYIGTVLPLNTSAPIIDYASSKQDFNYNMQSAGFNRNILERYSSLDTYQEERANHVPFQVACIESQIVHLMSMNVNKVDEPNTVNNNQECIDCKG